MPVYSPLEWTLILAAAFGDGFLVRTFGQGIGITLTPLLTLAFAPRFALGLLAFYSSLASLGMARDVWSKWDRRTTFTVLPGQLGGVLLGVWIVTVLPDAKLRWIIGLLCLLFAIHRTYVELSGHTPKARRLPLWLGTIMGGASGLASALAQFGRCGLGSFPSLPKLSQDRSAGHVVDCVLHPQSLQGRRVLAVRALPWRARFGS